MRITPPAQPAQRLPATLARPMMDSDVEATVIVGRDLVIVAGAVAFHFLVGRVEMAPSWLSKFNTVLEFSVLSVLLADAAQAIEVTAWLPPLFIFVTVTIVASGVHYVWVWGRRALRSKRGAAAAEPR